MKKFRKSILTILTMLFFGGYAMAQDVMGGMQGINSANNALRQYFAPLSNLILIIGAIVGLIGAVKVYKKFSSGDQDAGKTLAAWGGGCIFLVLSSVVIKAFFGV